jgi:GxxExxY protein
MNTDWNKFMPDQRDSSRLKHGALTEQIIGVFYGVYNELGYGFLESVYRESMRLALEEVGLQVGVEVPIPVSFKGHLVGQFKADLLVEYSILLELKSARLLDRSHEAQLLHYLKATQIEVGLLLNFGIRPQFRRLLFDNERKKIRENPCESVAEGSS